jgi:hypothetical protein
MEQLTLFGEVGFNENMDFIQMLDECRSDLVCRCIGKFDKPVGLSWDIWYTQVLESAKLNGPLSRRNRHVVR